MYQYIWDTETGGLLLTSDLSKFSKEPRPVYYRELYILGFDRYWTYPRDDRAPIMWAEANNYIYKGRTIAKTKGGSLYTAPELIVLDDSDCNNELEFVDIDTMVERNRKLLETLVQESIQKVYNTYIEYQNKVDLFYVAFSGGKDSIVALDIVQRALPHDEFLVLFGDTQMEFPDTYDVVKETMRNCEQSFIKFFIAKSEQSPSDTWHEFGPPSQTNRWCCSVHKTSPQILLLRKITGNPSFRGMAFTGIRGDESASRSQYDSISLGEKHKGQYSCHPILNWSSAEVFLHIYTNDLILNETYKKGNGRAGCLVCPLAAPKNFYFKQISYSESESANKKLTTTFFNNIILETTSKVFSQMKDQNEFMDICGWRARRSGRELNFAKDYCMEEQEGSVLTITLLRRKTDWREWIKTIGDIIEINNNHITILFRKKKYEITINESEDEKLKFSIETKTNTKDDIYFLSALKTVFRKSAYCIGCHVCEANCPNGFITMDNGKVTISDDCIKCHFCHDVFQGCLVANSLRLPKGEMKMGSIDRYGNLGVEFDWVISFIDEKDDFWTSDKNDLGTNKIKSLRAFLNDAGLTKKGVFSDFGSVIANIGIKTSVAWGLILCNLVYTSEFNWWVINTHTDGTYSEQDIIAMLGDKMSSNSRSHVARAYKNIFISNEILGKEIGLGECDYEIKNGKRKLNSIYRKSWSNPVSEVILYSLYKFAEACGDYYQFTLETLLDDSIERDGVSPTRIFGLDRETMIPILNGLSVNYPDFISASFTLDLDNITLDPEKTSADVLQIFKEGQP